MIEFYTLLDVSLASGFGWVTVNVVLCSFSPEYRLVNLVGYTPKSRKYKFVLLFHSFQDNTEALQGVNGEN